MAIRRKSLRNGLGAKKASLLSETFGGDAIWPRGALAKAGPQGRIILKAGKLRKGEACSGNTTRLVHRSGGCESRIQAEKVASIPIATPNSRLGESPDRGTAESGVEKSNWDFFSAHGQSSKQS